jgi:hypothetical protein
MTHKLIKTDNYLLVVDDNKDIEENMWTVKDGKVREVSYLGQDNGYAIIAHLPLNGSPILEGVDLLPPLEDDIERFAEIFGNNIGDNETENIAVSFGYKTGYNKAREKYNYTEEDMRNAISETRKGMLYNKKYEDEYIESLNQYPTEFECEMKQRFEADKTKRDNPLNGVYYEPKTITTAQGVQWVGKYK